MNQLFGEHSFKFDFNTNSIYWDGVTVQWAKDATFQKKSADIIDYYKEIGALNLPKLIEDRLITPNDQPIQAHERNYERDKWGNWSRQVLIGQLKDAKFPQGEKELHGVGREILITSAGFCLI